MMQCCHPICDKIEVEVEMTQGPGPNLIPLTKLTLSEILSGSLNSLRRMPKTLLGIGLFSGFIIGLSNIIATALVVRNGETLTMPELPNPSEVITQQQIQELVSALAPTLRVGVITAVVLFIVQAVTAGMFTHDRILAKNKTTIGASYWTFNYFFPVANICHFYRAIYWCGTCRN
jgi:hypothetical protein